MQHLDFDLCDHAFNIPQVIMKLSNLFVLMATSEHDLGDIECIQHMHAIYGKILQPKERAQWFHILNGHFDEGTLTTCQGFMNTAAAKFSKISKSKDRFKGLTHMAIDEIIALFAKKCKVAPQENDQVGSSVKPSSKKMKSPLFVNSSRPPMPLMSEPTKFAIPKNGMDRHGIVVTVPITRTHSSGTHTLWCPVTLIKPVFVDSPE